jgi:predicted cobalt transporter CbtA
MRSAADLRRAAFSFRNDGSSVEVADYEGPWSFDGALLRLAPTLPLAPQASRCPAAALVRRERYLSTFRALFFIAIVLVLLRYLWRASKSALVRR